MSRLASVFALNRSGLNVSRGIEALAILAVPFVVLTALDDQVYMLSAIFGVLFVALSDPGGEYRERLRAMGGVAIGGTLITALGFGSVAAAGDSSSSSRSSSRWRAGWRCNSASIGSSPPN